MAKKDNKPASAETKSAKPSESPPASDADRRGFIHRTLAVVIGGICSMVPFASGLAVLLDPLRRKSAGGQFHRVATLDSVPDDGVARQFPVIADRTDAWNTFPQDVIGSVFLRRERGSSEVQCFNARCPHAGCYVDYVIADKQFHCPCHDSSFEPSGARINPGSCPSPRDLDSLSIDSTKLQQGEVWIEFKDFQTGQSAKKEM